MAPFASVSQFTQNHVRPLTVVGDAALPPLPEKRRYLGQSWASGHYGNHQFGGVVRGRLTGGLSIRAGLFRAVGDRPENYSEIYAILPGDSVSAPLASHLVIADPLHRIRSTSGEAQLFYSFRTGAWQHRLIAGFRARKRVTQTGGSDRREFGTVVYGERDPQMQPQFQFSAPNTGQVRQSSLMLGYNGRLADRLSINLGVQKARYRASVTAGSNDLVTGSRDDPWLYNATVTLHASLALSIYAGMQRGLEDSGLAPENARNRNVQLAATRTRQYEGGLRWKFPHGQLVVDAFQITKPYFSFDANRDFAPLGTVRHRGIEASLSGQFGKRLHVLAGAVLMQPQVIGAARDAGLVGERPAGTPSLFAKIDANYRTGIFGGLTPTASLTYVGERAVGARPVSGAGRQATDGAGLCCVRSRAAPVIHAWQGADELPLAGVEPVRHRQLESGRCQHRADRRAAAAEFDGGGGFLIGAIGTGEHFRLLSRKGRGYSDSYRKMRLRPHFISGGGGGGAVAAGPRFLKCYDGAQLGASQR